jgi:hypothetical protein
MKRLMSRITRNLKDWSWTYYVPGFRKFGTWRYLTRRDEDRLDRATFNRLWAEAKTLDRTYSGFFAELHGSTKATHLDNFFYLLARWETDAADKYRCIYGCCVVEWLNGKNRGGWGPVGCPCDDMADPRGELIEAGVRK